MDLSLDALKQKIADVRASLARDAGDASAPSDIQGLRDRLLGRKGGAVTLLLKELGRLPGEARREAGQMLNDLKNEVEDLIGRLAAEADVRLRAAVLRRDWVDTTLPGRRPHVGRRHPLTVVRQQLEDIFVSMGYLVYEGREVEDDYHCFEALNMPPDHPARDMQDTFYIADRGQQVLLRTHTSSAQIRYMLENPHPPDVRIISTGKVFRRDSDVTHSPMFHQVEALVVGRGIHLGHLKGTIEAFLHALFGEQFPVRFRPSYFPYTEPSVEADLGCVVCGGGGRLADGAPCRICKGTGWLEILGSGMVNPAVFEAVNRRLGRTVYDPEEISGFAFGLGIERVAMVRHGVDDIRLFFENDLRFLEQFRG